MKKLLVGLTLLLIATILFSSQLIAAAIYSQFVPSSIVRSTVFWASFFEIGSLWLISIDIIIAIGGYTLVMNAMKEKSVEESKMLK